MNARTLRPRRLLAAHPVLVIPVTAALIAVGLVTAPLARGAAGSGGLPARSSAVVPSSVLATSGAPTCSVVGTVRTCPLFARASAAPVAWPGVTTTATVWSYTSAAADPVRPVGPTIVATVGEQLHLVLTNQLGGTTRTGLSVPQLEGLGEDTAGVADGATKDYAMTLTRPGTFLYEASGTTDGARQVAMGLVGALVVLPAAPGTAYGAGTEYTDEGVVLLTDIDPALNANPTSFDMRNYNPKLHLINGAPSPATTRIESHAGTRTLLRVLNGGIVQHAIGVLGTTQRVIGSSSRVLTHPVGVAAENVSAGDTADVMVDVPATGGPLFAVYDASTRLDNVTGSQTGVVAFGGALTFLDTGAVVVPPSTPSVTALAVAAPRTNGSADLGFTAVAGSATDPAVTGVEYVLDNGGAAGGTGIAVPAPTGVGPLAVSGSIPAATLTGLATGAHTLMVRANGANGWGPLASVTFVVDRTGPTASLTLTPTATNNATLSLNGTATDAATGGSTVASVSYSVDGGAAVAITVTPAVTVALAASVPTAALGEGAHTVTVVATDSLGNAGSPSQPVSFVVDRHGPTVSGIVVTPSTNNGSQGTAYDPTVVEIKATSFTDPVFGGVASGVAVGEAFLGSTGANGTGFPLWLYPTGSPTSLLGTFPVSELTKYGNGPLTVYVHAKDAAGNWGVFSTGSMTISRNADSIFASDFQSPTTLVPPWANAIQSTGSTGRLTAANAVTSGANRALVITKSGTAGSTFSNTSSRAYVVDLSPTAETRYNAAVTLTPTLVTGTTQNNARVMTILAARTGAGANAITVDYRAWGTTRQVRMTVLSNGAATATAWRTLASTTTPVALHLTWLSGASTTATFTVTGLATPTVSLTNLNTLASTIETTWLGVSAVTGTGQVSPGTLSLDNFDSRRITAP